MPIGISMQTVPTYRLSAFRKILQKTVHIVIYGDKLCLPFSILSGQHCKLGMPALTVNAQAERTGKF